MIFKKDEGTGKPANKGAQQSQKTITQREAVFRAVNRVIRGKKVTFKPKQPVGEVLNDFLLSEIHKEVTAGLISGKVALKSTPSNKKKLSDEKLMGVYVKGLVNNWVRRDKRLNGTTGITTQ